MVYFNEKYLSIEYDEKVDCIVCNWKSAANHLEFRQGLQKGLELAMEKKPSKWATDQTKMSGIKKEDQVWTYEEWFPKIIDCGIRYMAIITPENPLTQFTVNNILKNVDVTKIHIQFFEKLSKAKKWLADK